MIPDSMLTTMATHWYRSYENLQLIQRLSADLEQELISDMHKAGVTSVKISNGVVRMADNYHLCFIPEEEQS